MLSHLSRLKVILAKRSYAIVFVLIMMSYLIIFLSTLGNITFNGKTVSLAAVEWTKMFNRSGYLTFEPVVRVTFPYLTILVSPINILIGFLVSGLVGLNLTVTVLAFRQPRACSFNPTAGLLASLPALLAGGACCAPAIVLLLGLQMSIFLIMLSQLMIPIAIIALTATLLFSLRQIKGSYLRNV